ncbi:MULTISPECIES: efflux RND transporter periplasmic adaptor subunit [Hymenobacter]|jgi:RND family efflux transporter MFP subunit|uniref:Efflux RND transporter periplasmic adaptor subunit n=2 Tax=Hymenobacter TaxID=89966 RepID=A0A4Z0MCY0_9BACT|nr:MULTISPECIES: efflux RND transporter periplasmic adaptor subunit [Hymenobacter]TGD77346.1 efflux RND transporter periplasmic adaptor subunit [Hymenobacter wooponensis]TGE03564.1 efflux RND transporter periplasmic adaptor subunit [Hymenobacter fodinae]
MYFPKFTFSLLAASRCLALSGLLGGAVACGKAEKPKAVSPSEVANPVKESDLTTVTITADAEKRLGIKTVAVKTDNVQATREVGGEIQAVPGQAVTIVAPVQGTLRGGAGLTAGQRVRQGQTLYQLVALPAERDLLTLDQGTTQARTQLQVAQARLQRAEALLADRAGSVRARDDARADVALAQRALADARARQGALNGNTGGGQSLPIKAPLSGVVQRVTVAPGSLVTANTVLLELASLNKVWVRVPLFVGDLRRLGKDQAVTVRPLNGGAARQARPVEAPTIGGTAGTATADVFYEIDNTDEAFRPGERVAVDVTLGNAASGATNGMTGAATSTAALTVPTAALLYDASGGQWVYVRTKPLQYVRQRVEVQRAVGDQVVISRGVKAGAEVVTDGAAELFGTEFGGSH